MPKKSTVLLIAFIFGVGALLVSCAGMQTKPTAANFKNPVITLDSVQLSYYTGWWTYGKAKVALGKAPEFGGSSAVTLAFVFEITNPNSYPVLLNDAQFFLYFDDYELRIVKDMNEMWIPAGKTNSKVLHVTLDPVTTWGKFLLAGKQLAQERGDKPWDKVSQWWLGLPDMALKIDVTEGSFSFRADGVPKVVGFSATYP
ncbi:MAG: hypothetical protein JRL30_29165 [Deltaproteobacteria bacterium]|nr:hypothetical protein [Deltaproteobacteria bacterium]